MLDPDDRHLLVEALKPPPGMTLDIAVGTTFTLDLQAVEHFANLGPAAVYNNGVCSDLTQKHNIAREQVGQIIIAHGMAAIFDNQCLAGMAAHIRQRLR